MKDEGIVLYDKNDKPFFSFYGGRPDQYVELSQISPNVRQAVISGEDRDFYSEPGFSVKGIVRSAYLNFNGQNISYGGSTITQQLVKNTLLSSEKSLTRKLTEMILALALENKYSKSDILEMYLNTVYFGRGAYGIKAAADNYFGTDPSSLTLPQAAYLAAVLPAPSYYEDNIDGALERRKVILDSMARSGYIFGTVADRAAEEPVRFRNAKQSVNSQAVHFALYVWDWLAKNYSEDELRRSGWHIKTTLDLDKQTAAQSLLTQQVIRLAGQGVTNGAVVIIDPKTGNILAMVGSADWENNRYGKVNMATSPRQPGSAFKPLIYAAALEQKLITPATYLRDMPTTFPGNYKPHDYDGLYRGRVTVRRALANSLNIPAVEVMQRLGVDTGVEAARRLGINSLGPPENYGLSLVLGAGEIPLLELTAAYAVFANEGKKSDVLPVETITDRKGGIVFQNNHRTEQVLDPAAAFLITSILSDGNARREIFGNQLDAKRPAAVKTGTSENYRDSLTVGYTPDIVVGVWVGNNDNSRMANIAGSLGAAPVWRSLISSMSATSVTERSLPLGVNEISYCRYERIGTDEAKLVQGKELFMSGTEPPDNCRRYSERNLYREQG